MIRRTNNAIFAYKVKLPAKYDLKYFKDNFPDSKSVANLYEPKDSSYLGSLIYQSDDNETGGIFFKFSKIRKKDFLLTDLTTGIQSLSGLKKTKKYTNNSYFVYYPDSHIILGLYNDEAMKHIIAPLTRYFQEHILEKDVSMDMIKLPVDIDKILPNISYVNSICIHTALQNIDFNAQKKKLNPFRALDEYAEEGEIIQYFPYLKTYGIDKIKRILGRIISNTKAHHIWVKTDNMDIDLLGKILLHFPCAIELDDEDIPNFLDFKKKATEIYKKHKDNLLANY